MTPHPVQQFKCDLSGMTVSNLKCFLLQLDIKRPEPGILFISLPILLFRLAIMTYFLVYRFSVIGNVIQNVQRHHVLLKAHA